MTRAQRRIHLTFWLLLAPLALVGVALLIANAPDSPTSSPVSTTNAETAP